MIVTQEHYQKMKDVVMNVILEGRKIKASDCFDCDCDIDSLISLHGQILVRQSRSRKSIGHNVTGMMISKMQCGQKESDSLVNISRELGIGSYRAAKLIVTFILGQDVTMAHIIENPNLILDDVIRQNIMECITNDPLNSLEIDQMKECTGIEFEALLLQQLLARKMCFETEAELRNRGKPKTPDILLLIPMGVLDIENNEYDSVKKDQLHYQQMSRSQRPSVINWIDSKGMFADEETFEENYEQLKSYVNRYGAGMVIYWHGYVQSLTRVKDEMIFISDKFPENWIFPTGDPADGREPDFDLLIGNNKNKNET